ncbi:MAG: ADP-ribosyltransferase domain-containing protein [Janthinobacterium lividum]
MGKQSIEVKNTYLDNDTVSTEIFIDAVNVLLAGADSVYFFDARAIAGEKMKGYLHEIAIVNFYTKNEGKAFNEILKTQEQSDDADLFKLAMTYGLERLVKEGIAKTCSGRFFRGTRPLSDGIYECKEGDVFKSHSFISSTDEPRVADDYEDGCLVEIEACEVYSVNLLSEYQNESEFIFQCGIEFKIVSVEMEEGIKIVKMKQICGSSNPEY